MKQATLKLKRNIQSVNITNNNIDVQQMVLKSMLATLGLLGLFYVLILGNMVFNIVQRKTLEKEALSLSNDVGNLETSYLSVSQSVDLSLSSTMGFHEAQAAFATRKSLSSLGSVSMRNNEI